MSASKTDGPLQAARLRLHATLKRERERERERLGSSWPIMDKVESTQTQAKTRESEMGGGMPGRLGGGEVLGDSPVVTRTLLLQRSGFRGVGFGFYGFGCRVLCFGFRVLCFGFRVSDFGFRVCGFGSNKQLPAASAVAYDRRHGDGEIMAGSVTACAW
eukprot:699188-Rhodomonas_salina.1